MRANATNAECLVFTFKEGLLSKIAHDLKIRVERFEIRMDEDRIEATFDTRSLRVVCAREKNSDRTGVLSPKDREKIEGNITRDVLHASRHPEAQFVGVVTDRSESSAHVKGELTLHGVSRTMSVQVDREVDAWAAEVRLHQPDFGITPYSAMLGTLKVSPEVIVRVRVPT